MEPPLFRPANKGRFPNFPLYQQQPSYTDPIFLNPRLPPTHAFVSRPQNIKSKEIKNVSLKKSGLSIPVLTPTPTPPTLRTTARPLLYSPTVSSNMVSTTPVYPAHHYGPVRPAITLR